MRIGIDARSLGPLRTGVGTYLSEILNCWPEEEGVEFHPFSHQEVRFPMKRQFRCQTDSYRWGLPWYLFRSHKIMNQSSLDVFWGAQNLLPRKLPGEIPAVITIHDCVHLQAFNYSPSLPYRLLHRYFFPQSVRRSSRILAVSSFVAGEIQRYYGTASAKIEVTPLGVRESFRREQMNLEKTTETIARYKIEMPFILGVGTLEPRKNLRKLLQAFSKIPQNLQGKYQLVLVGKPGWRNRELMQQIRSHPQASQIRLTGYVPESDLPYFYAAAEMLVFPSFYEGFGLPVLEAMASGCPVISSNAASLPEVLGQAAIQIDPESPAEEWSKTITRLLSSEDLKDSLRSMGLLRARDFSWEKCAQQTLEVLKNVVK